MRPAGFGIALSGGGFRASFFHLGVLARLAEIDALRSMEILSTVSGGSILGGALYLKLKRLLESKEDGEIRRQDYLQCLRELERDFLEGVQTNVRMRALASLPANARMAVSLDYSRSDRLAELYDRTFYRPLLHPHRDQPVLMRDLLIRPRGESVDAKNVNQTRSAKVPMLFVNATTLNTGRHWIFTPTWMGERFDAWRSAEELGDVNGILKGLPYSEAKEEKYRDLSLGVAVAASACIPGLFMPLALSTLYPKWRAQLVDGGVHDNQGISILNENRCSSVLVSDGSGLMGDIPSPLPFIPDVLARTFSISMDRIRDLAMGDVLARAQNGTRPGLIFHLREGIPLAQIEPQRKVNSRADAPSEPRTTEYGVHVEFQKLLSQIRTDLDAFSDIEADALMANGYLIAERRLVVDDALSRRLGLSQFPPRSECQFRFSWIFGELAAPKTRTRRVIATGSRRFLKLLSLIAPLRLWLVPILALLAYAIWKGQVWSWNVSIAAHEVLAALVLAVLLTFNELRLFVQKLIVGLFTVTIGWAFSVIYLGTGSRVYLWYGRRGRRT
jgi:predicted acylesterase/phospholipase RssA